MQSNNDPTPENSTPVARTQKAALKFTVLPANYTQADLNKIIGMAEYVIVRKNDSWQVMSFNKKDVNNRFVVPLNLEAEGKLIPSMAELNTELATISEADLTTGDNAASIEKVHELLTDHSKKVKSYSVIGEVLEKEEAMLSKINEFLQRMDEVLASPQITDGQKEELRAYLEPYKKIAASNIYKNLNLDIPEATSYFEKVIKMAQAVTDRLVTTKGEAAILNEELVSNINSMGQASMVSSNFMAVVDKLGLDVKFPKTESQQIFNGYIIIPTQHAPRYKMLTDAFVTEISKLAEKNHLTGPLLDTVKNIDHRIAAIGPEVAKANEKVREIESLGSKIRTNNIIGSLAHEALVAQTATRRVAPDEAVKWAPFLQNLNSIGDDIINKQQILGKDQPISPTNLEAESKLEASPKTKFYEPLMNTFVDAYLEFKPEAPGMTGAMLNFIAASEKKLRQEGVSGIIYNDDVKRIPAKTTIKNVFATMTSADPKAAERIVTALFDKTQKMLESAPKGQANLQHETAYKNAFDAVRMMGADAIRIWNENAAEKFYDLSLFTTIPNKPVFKHLDYQNIINVEKTEAARAQILFAAAGSAAVNRPAMRDALMNIPRDASPRQKREGVLGLVMQQYQEAYLNGRTKNKFRATVKTDDLHAMEAVIEAMEKTIAGHGQLGVLGRDLDARGKANREEIILPAALALPPDQFNKSMRNLYDAAKAAVTSTSANTKTAYVYVNSFKILERITGSSPKTEWDKINKADNSPTASALSLSDSELTGKLHEDAFMVRYNTLANLSPQVESPPGSPMPVPEDSPISNEKAAPLSVEIDDIGLEEKARNNSDSDEEKEVHTPILSTDSPRSRSATTAQVSPRPSTVSLVATEAVPEQKIDQINQTEFKQLITKDILGKIADELAAKRAIAAKYGFNQVKLWDNFSLQVTNISNDMIKNGETFSQNKFYTSFMQTFIDGYLMHAKGQNDLFSEGIRDFLEKIDKYLHTFRQAGIVYKEPANLPQEQNKDAAALNSMANRNDGDVFQNNMVKYLFDNLQKLIEAPGVHAKYEERVFQRTIDAVNTLGAKGIAEWNKLAGMEFSELEITNGKIKNTYPELTAIGGTEVSRRQTLLAVLKMGLATAQQNIAKSDSAAQKTIMDAEQKAVEKAAANKKLATPEARAAAVKKALDTDSVNEAKSQLATSRTISPEIEKATKALNDILKAPMTRAQMNQKFKYILLELFTKGYVDGRKRSKTLLGNETIRQPALQALENFIIGIETQLVTTRQKYIFVDKPSAFNPMDSSVITGKYKMSEVIFETANSLAPEDFNQLIQSLYDGLNHHPDSRSAFVNTYKILERIGEQAKEQWNLIVSADKELSNELKKEVIIPNLKITLKEDLLESKYAKLMSVKKLKAPSSFGIFGKAGSSTVAEVKKDHEPPSPTRH